MKVVAGILILLCLNFASAPVWASDALPSWREGKTKQEITSFVRRVTDRRSHDFVPQNERIAVFDNDGTLWAEQPVYFQALFVFERIRAMAAQHPEWKDTEPYKSAIGGDAKGLASSGEKGLTTLIATTHAGMTSDEFSGIVKQWISTARHPQTKKPLAEMVYQPMQELLAYLRGNGFKTYIVSGGGQDFMRPWTEEFYGIPPEQVIGSQGGLKYEVVSGVPMLVKLPDVVLIDDHAGKPVGIQRAIGRRPIFAFGNSDGDREMLEWTMAGAGPRFAGLVHHTDAKREWSYDRHSKVGTLDKALDQAKAQGWTVTDMAQDWVVIFPVAPSAP
jgi:phosphoglycolate phosphatase-like HAD superfamily hydrolase